MRILHLEASPGWGGQEIRILREAEGMRSRGHDLFFAVMKGGGLAQEARQAGFPVVEMAFQKSAWGWTLFRLIRLMRQHRIEIVNTHSSLDSWIGGIAARACQIPIVRTRHLSTGIKPGWNSRWLYGSLADFVVTTCSAILPMISLQAGKPLSAMRSIPTGVDPVRIESMKGDAKVFRRSLSLSDCDFLVGTACFMRSWKGIGDFLEAASLLRQEPNLRWVIIGGGHEETYRARAKELSLEGIVHFTGHLANPIPALQALDAFALLSTAHEGVSQAILQAAFLEKPLIATATGGLSEVCLDGKTGIQVPPYAPLSVAEAVLRFKREGGGSFGKEGRALVLKEFTLQRTLDEMEEVYRKILS